MNKIIAILVLIAFGQSITAQTYYYRYTKSIIKGKTDTNVSGGQFITFDGKKCFESDKYGNNVGNGSMSYDAEVSKSTQLETYWGACYWSKNAYMKFNADKTLMNIETNAGKIYVYKRATAPAGAKTCSLIRKSDPQNSSGGGGGGYVQPTYPVQQPVYPQYPQGGYAGGGTYNSGNSGGSSNTNSNSYRQEKPQKTRHTCSFCKGTGQYVKYNNSTSIGNKGYMERCSTCGETYWSTSPHLHLTCPQCHGRGYKEY